MPRHGKRYSATRARNTSRRVNEQTLGTHVARRGQPSPRRRESAYAEALKRRARARRIAAFVIVAVVIVAIAVGAGVIAFRGAVGGSLSLKDSDARDSLVAVRSSEPSYVLASVELGSVAAPLDNGGPDVFFLARLDSANRSVALVAVPPELQITTDNQSSSLASIANRGDAALISAFSTFAKVDISHFVKIGSAADVAGLVDALDGVPVEVSQKIDDPHAGNVCIPEGARVLDGDTALIYLRAANLEYGLQDRLENQLGFAAGVIERLFAGSGSFAARLDEAGQFIQTDLALSDLESLESWLSGISAADMVKAVLPGYYMVVTNVIGSDENRYVSSSSEVAAMVDDLENGRVPSSGGLDDVEEVKPSSFTVDIQNGTSIEGAASAAADELKAAGFKIGEVGNAEQPIYEETLVIYRDSDEDGLARAKTLIEAYGVGRAVDEEAYYTFIGDVLLVIGADNKPTS